MMVTVTAVITNSDILNAEGKDCDESDNNDDMMIAIKMIMVMMIMIRMTKKGNTHTVSINTPLFIKVIYESHSAYLCAVLSRMQDL